MSDEGFEALSSARWLLAAPGDFSSDCVAFMSDEGFDCAAEFPRSENVALYMTPEPADVCSRFLVPRPLANPAPPASAAVATDIIRRWVIECSPWRFDCPLGHQK